MDLINASVCLITLEWSWYTGQSVRKDGSLHREWLSKRIIITYSCRSHLEGRTKLSEVFNIPNSGPMGQTKALQSCFSLWDSKMTVKSDRRQTHVEVSDGSVKEEFDSWIFIMAPQNHATIVVTETVLIWSCWFAHKAGGVQLLPASQVRNVVPVVIDALHATFKVLPPSSEGFPAVRHPPKTQLEENQRTKFQSHMRKMQKNIRH